ncbi:1-aminocyclopropane-1-carboxylate deaminase/D-cysteine desulfhydrase [Saccharopolyspora gloriosae]|uniref:1-aminocyclopropane-1-carboxylate deaminase/D-cysteine desulfhydrase n=1 Tax=Saccharopolyspora gloriosae TaxID=455344 RepID=UPI001FB63467|nr:pyridoxal-phosphate dependent enzyme [Saccharopolyspora gloriosae]
MDPTEAEASGLVVVPSPLVELRDERVSERGVRVWLKRDDLLHPEVPGNKWRKLKYNLAAAKDRRDSRLLTFGGAFSNHLRATAAAGHYFGFETVGVVRGEEHLPLNESLAYAVGRGMMLTYLDRGTYRRKTEPDVLGALAAEFGPCYFLPEGGSNGLGVRGCAEVVDEIDVDVDVVCCATGSGGTVAAIAAGLAGHQRALGFTVLKGGQYLAGEVRRLQREGFGVTTGNWELDHDFHFGGYAKRKPELDSFISDFQSRHGIALDWVYEAKMMSGVFQRIGSGDFAPGTTIVAVLS